MAEKPMEPVVDEVGLSAWDKRIASFAEAIKKKPDEVSRALVGLVGEPGDEALAILSNPEAIQDADLQEVFVKGDLKIPLGVFRANLPKLRGPVVATAGPGSGERALSLDALPSVPDDTSFIEMLKVGGVLRVGPTEIISAMRAAIASQIGLFDLPDTIRNGMEKFAEAQDEPVGESFWTLQKLVTARNYGEVLSVMGVPGNFMSEKRKNALLEKLNEILWPTLSGFHTQLMGWQEAFMAGVANPAMALTMLAMSQTGGAKMMPPGMMQPPETDGLRDEAEGVINSINKVFAGTGIAVARALAWDATRIKTVLEEPTLPAALGVTTKDQMLKMLGISVGADFVRLERNITRYALAVVELPKVGSGNDEYAYLGALLQLGAAIPWDRLPGMLRGEEDGRPAGLPPRRRPGAIGIGRS